MRNTGLNSGKELKSSSTLSSSSSLGGGGKIAPRSKKMQKLYEESRIPFVISFLEEHPYCQIRWDDQCQGVAVDVDEIKLRSQGGAKVPKSGEDTSKQFLATCRHCHIQKTSNPAEAKRRGFTI